MLNFDVLREINVRRCVRSWGHTLSSWSVAEWGNATVGEVGEACNIAKKLLRLRQGLPGNNKETSEASLLAELSDEIADFVIYADLWAASEGISLEDAIRKKFNKTSVKLGFDDQL